MGPHTLHTLLAAAASGDQSAWDGLVARFENLVWATVRSFRLGDARSADVVQTTWLRLVESIDRINDPERLGGWLATTARRECLRVLRDSGRSVPVGDEDILDRADTTEWAEPDATLLRDERDGALWRAFGRIAERCQRLLRLLTADPAPTYEDIGQAMEMPIGSIGPTRQRCLDRLRVELAAEGYES